MSKKRIVFGITAPVNKGVFNLETNYSILNVVTYQGSSYIAKCEVVGVLPTDTTKWQLLAQKGDSPIKGTDYFTESEINEFKSAVEDSVKTELDFDNTISEINQDISDLQDNKIDKNVNNLTNYYKKDEIYNKTEIDSKIASVYKYRDTVSTYNDLPSQNLTIGDVYNIENGDASHGIKAGDNVAWNGTNWDVLAGTVDLSGYQTKIDSSHKLSVDLIETNTNKQLVSQTEKDTFNAKYDKPSTGIPKTDLSDTVKTSLNKADSAIQEHQDISGKQDVLTFDNTPTENSNNPVKSGGIYTYINTLIGDIDTALDLINGEEI